VTEVEQLQGGQSWPPFYLLLAVLGCTDYRLQSVDLPVDTAVDALDTGSSPFGDDLLDPQPTVEPCQGDINTEQWLVEFAAREGCAWGSGDNLSGLQGYFRGHEEQAWVYPVAQDTRVCDVRFEFSQEYGGLAFPLRYDDHLLFTFNNRVIFTTFSPLLDGLDADPLGYAIFHWLHVRDRPMQFYVEPWAVGSDYTVDLPNSDVMGDAVLALDAQALSDVSRSALSVNTLDLQLYSFGDNDLTDCGHTGLSFWVEIDLASTQ